MKYVGLQQQISSNNVKSILLLLSFPLLILIGVYAFFYIAYDGKSNINTVNQQFILTIPFVLGGVAIWFLIAWSSNTVMIRMATGARPLERKENKKIYNITENLCMSVGMPMPKIYIIESDALNAFASGIDKKSYAVTLTRGIIDKLDDEELEGVIAHELTHIRNKDVRLLITSIIFVGIFAFVVEIIFRSLLYGNRGRRNKVDGRVMLIAMLISFIVYFFSILFKFALSRKREYLADAGAVELTKNPRALASALRKISGHSEIKGVKSEDIKELFIDNSPTENSNALFGGFKGLFSTHPPIEKRIQFLEQM